MVLNQYVLSPELYGNTVPMQICIPAGEQFKNAEYLKEILDGLLKNRCSRSDTVTAFGGGVICDMTAFAAAVYMRGMHVQLVPTTLLSMVDASAGGKSGIDYRGYKNLIGAFKPAETIFICTELLATLDEEQYWSGFAEVIKHALLSDDDFLDQLMLNKARIVSRDHEFLAETVKRSLQVKITFIEQDPCETKGVRQLLNLGHTFAHAYETLSDFTVPHGTAVAWGIAKSLQYGTKLGITDPEYGRTIIRFLNELGYPVSSTIRNRKKFMELMLLDKKKKGNTLQLIVQKNRGETMMIPVHDHEQVSIVISEKPQTL